MVILVHEKVIVLQGGSLPKLAKEVVRMEMFSFQDLILFATFLITLLVYIDRNNKRK